MRREVSPGDTQPDRSTLTLPVNGAEVLSALRRNIAQHEDVGGSPAIQMIRLSQAENPQVWAREPMGECRTLSNREQPRLKAGTREPMGESRTLSNRGQPRLKVRKEMRQIAAAPRGELAPGNVMWRALVLPQSVSMAPAGEADEVKYPAEPNACGALPRGELAPGNVMGRALVLPQSVSMAPAGEADEVKYPAEPNACGALDVLQSSLAKRAADAKRVADKHRHLMRLRLPGLPAREVPVQTPALRSNNGSYWRLRGRAASSCGSSVSSVSARSTTRKHHRNTRNKHGEGGTRSDLQLPFVPKSGDLILFSLMALLPFVLLGFSLITMLFEAPEQCLQSS